MEKLTRDDLLVEATRVARDYKARELTITLRQLATSGEAL